MSCKHLKILIIVVQAVEDEPRGLRVSGDILWDKKNESKNWWEVDVKMGSDSVLVNKLPSWRLEGEPVVWG